MNPERHHRVVCERLVRSGRVRPGPGSITWKVNREMVVLLGWARAILLQLAHPTIAAGVDRHSGFRGSLRAGISRLRSTVGAMVSLTFGDTRQMTMAAARIHGIHDHVQGVGPLGPYSAHDQDAQRWVHLTLVDSILATYERLVGPLSARERDLYVAEAAIMEPLMGLPDGSLPRTVAELEEAMARALTEGTLVVGETSRSLARALLYPPHWYAAWPLFRAAQALTFGTLPASVRAAYGFRWRETDERATFRWTVIVRACRRMLPPVAREWSAARGQ
ncbi:MAG: hypothetical protein AMXMBFR57_14590 [Acidimicrobiia bacterium]